ncbi:MAG: hypothetical protein M3N09_09165, partial [Actinomycetota bacterium]|nr:hypothetical protein [Actinomycetota bacterium]
RGREARNLQDLLLVEGLPLEHGPGERLELLAVFGPLSGSIFSRTLPLRSALFCSLILRLFPSV